MLKFVMICFLKLNNEEIGSWANSEHQVQTMMI